jgi:hypothetical protein
VIYHLVFLHRRYGKYSFKPFEAEALNLICGLHECVHEFILIVNELKGTVIHPVKMMQK